MQQHHQSSQWPSVSRPQESVFLVRTPDGPGLFLQSQQRCRLRQCLLLAPQLLLKLTALLTLRSQLPTADRTAGKRLELSLPGIQVLRVQTMLPAPRAALSLVHGSCLDNGGQPGFAIPAFSRSSLLGNHVSMLLKSTLPSVQGWCRNTSLTTD